MKPINFSGISEVSRSSEAVFHETEGKLFVLAPQDDELIELNETSSFVWKLLDTPKKFSQIIQSLVSSFEVDQLTAEKDVKKLLQTLSSKKIINIS
jgi:hypothetical protein